MVRINGNLNPNSPAFMNGVAKGKNAPEVPAPPAPAEQPPAKPAPAPAPPAATGTVAVDTEAVFNALNETIPPVQQAPQAEKTALPLTQDGKPTFFGIVRPKEETTQQTTFEGTPADDTVAVRENGAQNVVALTGAQGDDALTADTRGAENTTTLAGGSGDDTLEANARGAENTIGATGDAGDDAIGVTARGSTNTVTITGDGASEPPPPPAGAAIDSTLTLNGTGQVTMTYVGENAGYSNVVGVYDVNDPSVKVPLVGNTDTVPSGTQYDLGTYEDGSQVGLYITANGANGGTTTYYSDPALNPDGLNHIAVQQVDDGTLRIEVAFEDLPNLGDQDFNDAVIELSVTPAPSPAEDGGNDTIGVDVRGGENLVSVDGQGGDDTLDVLTRGGVNEITALGGSGDDALAVDTHGGTKDITAKGEGGADTITLDVRGGVDNQILVNGDGGPAAVLPEGPWLDTSLTAAVDGTLTATFIGEDAGYNNKIGVYDPLNPTDKDLLVANTNTTPAGTTYDLGLVEAGTEVGMYLVSNGSTAPKNTFYTDQSLNQDGFDHFQETQVSDTTVQLGIEDMYGGGDRDRNDAIMQLTLTPTPPPPEDANDTIDMTVRGGEAGQIQVEGAGGDDTITMDVRGGSNEITINGGDGNDTITVALRGDETTLNIDGGAGSDTIVVRVAEGFDTSKLTINNDGNDNVVFETLGGAGV